MTQSHKLKIEMSKSRERLAELSSKESLAEAESNEMRSLTDGYKDLEARYRAAIVSEGAEEVESTVDGESKEKAKILDSAKLGRYVQYAAEGRSIDGAEREANQAFEITGEGRLPLAMLAERRLEKRADSPTNIAANTVQKSAAYLDRVFEGTASEFLGVNRQSVSGLAAFPVINSGATAETVAKQAAKDAEAFGLSVETMEPRRVQARYLFNREDAARLGMVFENSIRADLRAALASAMDDEVLNGKGNLIDGLLDETPKKYDGTTDGAITGATTGKQVADSLAALIDGKYAGDMGDIKAVFNPAFFAYMRTLPISFSNTDGYLSTWFNMEKTAVMAAGHIGEITSQAGESYYIASLAKGLMGSAVHAVWDSVELIRDPYSAANTGQIALTLCGLHDFKVLRSANWAVRRVART